MLRAAWKSATVPHVTRRRSAERHVDGHPGTGTAMAWRVSSKASRLPASPPGALDGSAQPQCTFTGPPGQYGHCSAAALSQTVMTTRMRGAASPTNSSQPLLR